MNPEEPTSTPSGSDDPDRRQARRRSDVDIAVVTTTVEDRLESLSSDVAAVKDTVGSLTTDTGGLKTDLKGVADQLEAVSHRVEALNLNGSAAGLRRLGQSADELITIVTEHKDQLAIENARAVVAADKAARRAKRWAWAQGPKRVVKYIAPFILGAVGVELAHLISGPLSRIHIP